MSDEETKENGEKKEEKGLPKLLNQIEKIKTWVDKNEDEIKGLKESLGDGHALVKTFMTACLGGKPELAKEALTDFADVNELIINEAELAELGTGPDFVAILGTVWKGVVLVAKVAAQVNGIKVGMEDALDS